MRIVGARYFGSLAGVGALSALLGGCNSFDKPAEQVGPHLEIPLDSRPATTAATRPHPVSGGTLSVLKDGSAAIVADPDRDRISIVDLGSLAVRATIALEAGDEPGRSVEDAAHHVHVALRAGGAVVSIDPATGALLERRAVCKAPRGIAFEEATSLLHVACAEGVLVSLPPTGAAVRHVQLEPDLRDVIVQGSELWVTRFKSAEILRVDGSGALVNRLSIPKSTGQLSVPVKQNDNGSPPIADIGIGKNVTVSSGVAWRALANPGGGAVLVHEQQVDDEITISDPTIGGSAYGGGGGTPCDGIVKNAVTTFGANGVVTTTPFNGSPLAVDIAVSSSVPWVAIAHAGPADLSAPRPFMVFPGDDGVSATGSGPSPATSIGGGNVTVISSDSATSQACAFSEGFVPVDGPATAVAFTPSGQLLVQTQTPARLSLIRRMPSDTPVVIELGGAALQDTGHELFHRDAGGGIACASCHPEGGEDGHTWRFAEVGARRTQALHVGLGGTAPFHWQGDLADVGALMNAVFVGRMGGVKESTERTDALGQWLFAMQRPPAVRDAADPAAVRGKGLFESKSVGCGSCHSGEKLTSNQTVAIDAAREALQVPSLVAVAYRSPFMHDGCAKTLAARFDPACGGNAHGDISGLSTDQVSDLVAYLESL